MIQGLNTTNAPKAIGPYSQAMICDDLLFCSGQTPIDPENMQLVGDDIVPQTRRALENLQIVLKSAQLDLSAVVKTTVYLKNMADFERMNQVYAQMFGDHQPARTTVEVARLPLDALVEIECIARMPTRYTT
jgi:2-iminobutanoate/2-iminopropanoate deaminase